MAGKEKREPFGIEGSTDPRGGIKMGDLTWEVSKKLPFLTPRTTLIRMLSKNYGYNAEKSGANKQGSPDTSPAPMPKGGINQ